MEAYEQIFLSPSKKSRTLSADQLLPLREMTSPSKERSGNRTKSRERIHSLATNFVTNTKKVRNRSTGPPMSSSSSTRLSISQGSCLSQADMTQLPPLTVFQGENPDICLTVHHAGLQVLYSTGAGQLRDDSVSYMKQVFRVESDSSTQHSDNGQDVHQTLSVQVMEGRYINDLLKSTTAAGKKHGNMDAGACQLFWRAIVRPRHGAGMSLRKMRDRKAEEKERVSTRLYTHVLVEGCDTPKWQDGQVQLTSSNMMEDVLIIQLWKVAKTSDALEDSGHSNSRKRTSSCYKENQLDEPGQSSADGRKRKIKARIRTLSGLRNMQLSPSFGKEHSHRTTSRLLAVGQYPLENVNGRYNEISEWVAVSASGATQNKTSNTCCPAIHIKAKVLTDKNVPEVPGLSASKIYRLTLHTLMEHEHHISEQARSVATAGSAEGNQLGGGGSTANLTQSAANLSELATYVLEQVAVFRKIDRCQSVKCHWQLGTKLLAASMSEEGSADDDGMASSPALAQLHHAISLAGQHSEDLQNVPEDKAASWKSSIQRSVKELLAAIHFHLSNFIQCVSTASWTNVDNCVSCMKAISDLEIYRKLLGGDNSAKQALKDQIKESARGWYMKCIDRSCFQMPKMPFQVLSELVSKMTEVLQTYSKVSDSMEDGVISVSDCAMHRMGISFRSLYQRNVMKWVTLDTPSVIGLCTEFCDLPSTPTTQRLVMMTAARKLFSACSDIWKQKVLYPSQLPESSYYHWFDGLFANWHYDFESQCHQLRDRITASRKAMNIQMLTIKGRPPLLCTKSALEMAFAIEVILLDYKPLLFQPVLEHAFANLLTISNMIYGCVQGVVDTHWIDNLSHQLEYSNSQDSLLEHASALLNNIHYMSECVIKKLPSLLGTQSVSEDVFRTTLHSSNKVAFPNVTAVLNKFITTSVQTMDMSAGRGLKQLAKVFVADEQTAHLTEIARNADADRPMRSMIDQLSSVFSSLKKTLYEAYYQRLTGYMWHAVLMSAYNIAMAEETSGASAGYLYLAFQVNNDIYSFFQTHLDGEGALDSQRYHDLMTYLEERRETDPLQLVLSYSRDKLSSISSNVPAQATGGLMNWGHVNVQTAWIAFNKGTTDRQLAVRLCSVYGLQAINGPSLINTIRGYVGSWSSGSSEPSFYLTVSLSPEVFFDKKRKTSSDTHNATQHRTVAFRDASAILDETFTLTLPEQLACTSGVGVVVRAFQRNSRFSQDGFVGQCFVDTASIPLECVKETLVASVVPVYKLQFVILDPSLPPPDKWNSMLSRQAGHDIIASFLSSEKLWTKRARHSLDQRRRSSDVATASHSTITL